MGKPSYHHVTRHEDLGRIAQEIADSQSIALDIETTSLDPRDGEVRLVQVCTGAGHIYVIDLWQTGGLGAIVEVLDNASADNGQTPLILGQNLKFEHKWFRHHFGVHLWPLFDTYRASALITNGRRLPHNLGAIYKRYVPELVGRTIKEDENQGASDWSKPNLSQKQLDYAAEDVAYMHHLHKVLRAKLKHRGLLRPALDEFRAIWPEVGMELAGFYVNQDRWRALARANLEKAAEIRQELLAELPHPAGALSLPGLRAGWNLDSNPKILASLHRLGATDLEGTSKEDLAMAAKDYPLVDKVLEYRKYAKRASSFGESYLDNVRRDTGCIHTSFYPFTGAGRYSSSSPNLQQIPRSAEFRSCFTAPPGYVLIVCDYGQIELRLMAEASQDRVLLDIFREGGDPHKRTAAELNGISLSAVTKALRQQAKPFNFGFIYGLMPKKMVVYAQAVYGVTLSIEQAHQAHAGFFSVYSGVKMWQDQQWARYKPQHMVYTNLGHSGRYRYLWHRAHNHYLNTPIQGAGAVGLKRAAWNVYRRFQRFLPNDAYLNHMVHDELVAVVRDDPEAIATATHHLETGMKEAMYTIISSMPVEAESHHGKTWADAK